MKRTNLIGSIFTVFVLIILLFIELQNAVNNLFLTTIPNNLDRLNGAKPRQELLDCLQFSTLIKTLEKYS